MPDFDEMKKKSYFRDKIALTIKPRPGIVFEKDFEWKRKLIERAFKKSSPNDKNYGVYVTPISKKKYKVEIWTKIAIRNFDVPLKDHELADIFNLDPEFQDVDKELKKIKSNLRGECDAHYSKCFYKRRRTRPAQRFRRLA